MPARSLVYAILLCFVVGSARAQAPAVANQVKGDLLYLKALNPKAFIQSANNSLSPTERASLCQRGSGWLTIVCQIDPKGRVASVTSVKLDKAAGELSAPMIAKLTDGIRRGMITDATRLPQSEYKEVWIDYPISSFCE